MFSLPRDWDLTLSSALPKDVSFLKVGVSWRRLNPIRSGFCYWSFFLFDFWLSEARRAHELYFFIVMIDRLSFCASIAFIFLFGSVSLVGGAYWALDSSCEKLGCFIFKPELNFWCLRFLCSWMLGNSSLFWGDSSDSTVTLVCCFPKLPLKNSEALRGTTCLVTETSSSISSTDTSL